MTLKLSEIEAKFGLHHLLDDEWGEKAGEVYYNDAPTLTAWAKRATKVLERELAEIRKSRERFENHFAQGRAKEIVMSRLDAQIAELEQLLGEVGE